MNILLWIQKWPFKNGISAMKLWMSHKHSSWHHPHYPPTPIYGVIVKIRIMIDVSAWSPCPLSLSGHCQNMFRFVVFVMMTSLLTREEMECLCFFAYNRFHVAMFVVCTVYIMAGKHKTSPQWQVISNDTMMQWLMSVVTMIMSPSLV